MGIDQRVLENNPLRGNWGYKKHVDPKKAKRDDKSIPPSDMVFFPPDSAKCKFPKDRLEYIHRGEWIKPTYKRDFSQLGSNKVGFLTVSGDMRIAKGEKHSVTGKWNMMGFNDDVRSVLEGMRGAILCVMSSFSIRVFLVLCCCVCVSVDRSRQEKENER